MGKSRKSLKGYEFTNLLFFLGLIIVLGAVVAFVFNYYGTQDRAVVVDVEPGIASENTTGDIGVFYLEGFRISESTQQYRSRLEIPVTDDGLVRGLFDLPGIEEVTIQPQLVMVKKNGTVEWSALKSRVRGIIKEHLHSHY